MEGASWALGTGPTVRLGGERVVVRGRTLADYAMMEAELLKERGNVFDLVRRAVRPFVATLRQSDVGRVLFERIAPRLSRATLRETIEWMNTGRGRLFALWLAVRENDPRVWTLKRVRDDVARSDWSELVSAMDQASANDERCAALWMGLGGEHDGETLHWPSVFRRLAEAPFHMSAEQVGRLTLQQMRFCLWDAALLADGLEFESGAALRAFRKYRVERTRCAIDNIVRGLPWNAAAVDGTRRMIPRDP